LETRKAAFDMLQSLRFMIPCSRCRKHYCEYMDSDFGISDLQSHHLTDRRTISLWLVTLHNSVNQRLGKPTLTYEEVQAMYLPTDAVCPPPSTPPPPSSITPTISIISVTGVQAFHYAFAGLFVLLVFMLMLRRLRKESSPLKEFLGSIS
jgi:hypothetical protein